MLRLELKFVIHHSVRRMLLERWSPHLVRAAFTDSEARTHALSQYYDSPTLSCAREKQDGIPHRNKVRLRTYATDFDSGKAAFLEVKHRRFVGVHKYRQRIAEMSSALLCPSRWTFDEPDIEARFHSLLETYHLRASAQTYYQREAYEGAVETDVRITFDTVLLALHPRERLTAKLLHDPGRRLMADTLVILEVKATKGIPPWVYEGVKAAELQRKTIPKYVTAVEALGLVELSVGGVYA